MKIHTFTKQQLLSTDINTAWHFFSNPSNLGTITPASMNFRLYYRSGGNDMYAGQMIRYKVTVLPGVTVDWLTEITHVRPPYYCVDEQRAGPYALWHHQHHFREVSGGIEMTDEINYAIGYGPVGDLANRLMVKKQLARIFDFRQLVLGTRFKNDHQKLA